jgi:hypothetical protein
MDLYTIWGSAYSSDRPMSNIWTVNQNGPISIWKLIFKVSLLIRMVQFPGNFDRFPIFLFILIDFERIPFSIYCPRWSPGSTSDHAHFPCPSISLRMFKKRPKSGTRPKPKRKRIRSRISIAHLFLFVFPLSSLCFISNFNFLVTRKFRENFGKISFFVFAFFAKFRLK